MRSIFSLLLLYSSLLQADVQVQGSIENTSQYYIEIPSDKNNLNNTLRANIEAEYTKDDLTLKGSLSAQEDFYDLFNDPTKETKRSFVRLNELYGTYEFENDQLLVGKSIRFWGALEVRNVVDTFNPQDLRSDVFETDKLGVWNIAYAHYTEMGEFNAIVKFYEQDREMAAYPYAYYFFPETIATLDLNYKSKLVSEESRYRPSVYLKYAASTETEYALDYAFVYENGYDSQRYYSIDLTEDFTHFTTQEHAYLVNKFSMFNTLVVGATLFKMEALYTDVISNDINISDYYHLGFGLEHTLSGVYKEADLGVICEYYYYNTLDQDKYSDLELFETMQDDLFVGLRYTFNEGNDASVVGGIIADLEYDEEVYYMEYESRFAEVLKINFDYRYINPSKNYQTAFNLLGKHERVSLKIGYYF